MAAFGEEESMTSSLYSMVHGSQPLKRVEPSILKFTKIVIPTDLERLRQHKINIEKFHRYRNWEKLTTEQINARQTVQQLKANIREMEKTRSLIIEEDLPSFDSRVSPVKTDAIHAVVSFLEMHDTEKSVLGVALPVTSGSETGSNVRRRQLSDSTEDFQIIYANDTVDDPISEDIDATQEPDLPKEAELAQLMLEQADKQSKASQESWRNLQNDLISLNTLVHEFATHVRAQGEVVDTISDNIDQSEQHVSKGRMHLIKASSIKAALLPLSGAIIGGCLGGPIGLYAGLKMGTIVALGGSAVGFASATFLKKRKEKQNSLEMEEMTRSSAQLGTRRRTSDPGPRSEQKKTR